MKIVIDYDNLEAQGMASSTALDVLRSRRGWYDPALLETFCALRGSSPQLNEIKELPLRMVQPGMIFAADVRTPGGALLVARGYEVTDSLIQRILNFSPEITKQHVRAIVRRLPSEVVAV